MKGMDVESHATTSIDDDRVVNTTRRNQEANNIDNVLFAATIPIIELEQGAASAQDEQHQQQRQQDNDVVIVEGVLWASVQNDAARGWIRQSKRRIVLSVAIALLIVTVVVIAVVLVTTRRPEPYSCPFPDNSTLSPEQMNAIDSLRVWLVQQSVSSEQDLYNSCSPQFSSLWWLAMEDQASTTTFTTATANRYIVAAIYFANGGVKWYEQLQFLSNKSICLWHNSSSRLGVSCDNNVQDKEDPTTIWLADNNLKGTILSELGRLPKLTSLNLSRNSLTGSIIPRELANLSTLQSLDLSSSFLIGPIPLEFGNLYELQYFDISDNLMSGSIPSELGALSQLVNMNLAIEMMFCCGSVANNYVYKPEFLRREVENDYFYCGDEGPSISGTIPSELGRLTGLTSLDISLTFLNGTIPSELGRLSHLKRLDLSSTCLSGHVPSVLATLPNISCLDLSATNLIQSNLTLFFCNFSWKELCVDCGHCGPNYEKSSCMRPAD